MQSVRNFTPLNTFMTRKKKFNLLSLQKLQLQAPWKNPRPHESVAHRLKATAR